MALPLSGRPYGREWLALSFVFGIVGLLVAHFKFRRQPGYDLWPLVKWMAIGYVVMIPAPYAIIFGIIGVGAALGG